jgi:3-deoxy-D-manno-octulosonic acid kinase
MTEETIKQAFGEPNHYFLYDGVLFDAHPLGIFGGESSPPSHTRTGLAAGRGATWFFRWKDVDLVWRHSRRGGLVGRVVQDRYLFFGLERTRVFREFRLLCFLQQRGLAVPQPVLAHVVRERGTYGANLVTRRIPQAQDLATKLRQEPLTPLEWRQVGATIAALHRQQVWHRDLNLRNVLMDRDGKFWLIDFDRCHEQRGSWWKAQVLRRLFRSLNKEKERDPGLFWQPSDQAWILEGYDGDVSLTISPGPTQSGEK